ncbi:MAG: copper homeostasis membrane protein CopD [Xanthobacteraceae bacterium]
MTNLLYYARAVHFAATIMASGIVFFTVFVADPALRRAERVTAVSLRCRLAWIAWISLAFAVLSGAAWLVLTASSMSGQPVADVLSQGVLWTVLSQTDFGNDWLARAGLLCLLGAALVPLLSARGTTSAWLKAAALVVAASFVGSLAFAGHGIGDEGLAGIVHPAADILHLIAVAAWIGGLVPLALLLSTARGGADALATARTATLRFSILGIACVATILFTGIVNSYYLVGSIPAFTETLYGQLLMVKIALFALMVGIAAWNWSQLTPKLVEDPSAAVTQGARRALCRNATAEAALGALIIAIVAVLGTLAPASHANHHAIEGAIPADASFQHIHSEHGMADVMIEPGRVGTASVTIHLLDDDLETLPARAVTLTLAPPGRAGEPITRRALQDADGEWHANGVTLPQPGNWIVTVDAVLVSNRRLKLTAPIVIYAK